MTADCFRLRLLPGLFMALLGPAAQAACGVEVLGVAFGTYDPISGLDSDGVGNVRVLCTPAASYTIALSSGSGSYAARQLAAGAVALDYNLYSNPGRTLVWGDGSAGTLTVAGMGSDDNHPVYGRIPGSQRQASAGTYSDLIVVTVEF